jgi:uncharacterized protein YbjT (DUF2867 family)
MSTTETESERAGAVRRVKIILFGATGMVGQGTLLECLDDPEVERVLAVVRRPTGKTHEKLEELVVKDFTDYAAVEDRLRGYDACLFCLGVSAAGMKEEAYRHVTYDYTLAAAKALARLNPALTFCYVSGAGTDSTEKGWQMWARVKGKVENDLLALPLGAAFMFRPGFIQPVRGVVSSTGWYRAIYAAAGWMYPVLSKAFPESLMTSSILGRALLVAAKRGAPKRVLEAADINAMVPRASA